MVRIGGLHQGQQGLAGLLADLRQALHRIAGPQVGLGNEVAQQGFQCDRDLHQASGGGTGSSSSGTLIHLSPSSISITGMSSRMGYFRPQSGSWPTSQASLTSLSIPSLSRTQWGQPRTPTRLS